MLYERHIEVDSLTTRTADGVTQTPIWFGDPDRPLFGWFEAPEDGKACAGVVICPPLAVEGTTSKPGLRHLSTRLAAEGFAVLRFDYTGTGDSSGDDRQPGLVADWLASIRSAIRCLESSGMCPRRAGRSPGRGHPGDGRAVGRGSYRRRRPVGSVPGGSDVRTPAGGAGQDDGTGAVQGRRFG